MSGAVASVAPSCLQMWLQSLHKFVLALVVLIPSQPAVVEVVKVDGRVASLNERPDPPVLMRDQGEEVPLCHSCCHLLFALQGGSITLAPICCSRQERLQSGKLCRPLLHGKAEAI